MVVAPGVGVYVQQPTLGDALGMVQQPGSFGANDAAIIVSLIRQFVGLLR